jgi:hypothetical protein
VGLLGTLATEWPIVPAPGDYDDGEFGGMKIGKGNPSTRRRPLNPGRSGGKPVINCLSYGTSLM